MLHWKNYIEPWARDHKSTGMIRILYKRMKYTNRRIWTGRKLGLWNNMGALFYKNSIDNNVYTTVSYAADDGDCTEKLCECKIDVDPATKTWTISSWYTEEGHKHHGFGKLTLKACLDTIAAVHGAPDTVEYIWNGANQYVFDWLEENFGALSKCPIAVQKYASDDDWESHIYILNREKFLKYFGVEKL